MLFTEAVLCIFIISKRKESSTRGTRQADGSPVSRTNESEKDEEQHGDVVMGGEEVVAVSRLTMSQLTKVVSDLKEKVGRTAGKPKT